MSEKTNAPVQKKNESLYTRTLQRPVTYEDKTYDALSFDFDRLTGKDAADIEMELRAMNQPVIVPTISGDYLMRMAVRCCTSPIGMDVFDTMAIRDYNAIRSKARSFLLDSEL